MTWARHLACLLLFAIACGGEVELANVDGSATLSYDCDDVELAARSPADRAVVKEHALRIAREVAERGEVEFLTRLSIAYEDSDPALLERIVVGYVCERGVAEEPPSVFPEPGTKARDFALRQMTLSPPYDDGPLVGLRDQRGSVVVLDVFGTWCPPCLKKYPAMRKLAERYHGRGVQFFGLLLNDSPERAAKWFKEQGGLAYPFLLESNSDIESSWGLHGAPRMFVIDQQGLIADRCLGCQVGPLRPDSLPVLLDSLLAIESDGRLTSLSN